MMSNHKLIKSAVILAHPQLPDAVLEVKNVANWFQTKGVSTLVGLLNDQAVIKKITEGQYDILVALGGDGTMLRAGHLAGPLKLPILGINLGHFGFLIEVRDKQWLDFFPRLLNGDFWIENRMTLCAELIQGGVKTGKWDVLNEVVVSRGELVRPIKLTATVDGRFLTTYVADALIAATPTGSTAYALAAGGPILPPELRNILLVPVAPHLSLDRAIVLAEGSSVTINVQADHQSVFSIDGQTPIKLTEEDHLDVRAGDHTVQFVRFQDPGYFYRNLTPHMNQNPSTGKQR